MGAQHVDLSLSLFIRVTPKLLTLTHRSPACTYTSICCQPDGEQIRATRAGTLDTTSSTLHRGIASALPARQTGSTWAWACAVTETPTLRSSGTALISKSRRVSDIRLMCMFPTVAVACPFRCPSCGAWLSINYEEEPRQSLTLHAGSKENIEKGRCMKMLRKIQAQAVFKSVVD